MNATNPQVAALLNQLTTWGPPILAALAILIITHFVARGVKWAVARAVDRLPALQRQGAGEPGETIGAQIGALGYWLVWLVGLVVALQPLGLSEALTPVRTLTEDVFSYLPRLIGAGVIFFDGLIVAKVVRNIVEGALVALDADGWLSRAGAAGVAAGAPGPAAGAKVTLSRTIGVVVFALIVIPVTIAALETLGISAIADPAVAVLQTVLDAIPRVLAAAIVLGVAWFVGRWVRGLVEQIRPSLGFDRALTALGGFAPGLQPSRVVGGVALTAIMLFSAVEAARLLDFDAVSLMLVEVTELGGRVIFGAVIIVVGVILARILTRLVGQTIGESGLPSLLKYAIIAFSVAIGLRFMGLANEIVILAFGLILGSAAVAVALAFGLGGRDAAARLLDRYVDENGPPPRRAPRPPRIPQNSAPDRDEDEMQPPLV
jgi:hypothetical protein